VVVYNENKLLNFNHPTDSSLASVHAIEEIDGEINDPGTIWKLPSLNLPDLEGEERAKMDVVDIVLYNNARDENTLLKDFIIDGIEKKDRFTDPFEVLDTDYENFLVTYQCRQEFRLPEEKDYVTSEGETFREFVEEYDAGKGHDELIANHLLSNNQRLDDESPLDLLQIQIAEDDEHTKLSDADLNKEIDTLMTLDDAHKFHFENNRPSMSEWKVRRELYAKNHKHRKPNNYYKMREHEEKWFNSVQISVHVRDPAYYDNDHEKLN